MIGVNTESSMVGLYGRNTAFREEPQQVLAMIPCYEAGEDATLVVYHKGKVDIVRGSVKTVIRNFAKSRGIHLTYLRSLENNGCGYTEPFTLDPLHTFIMIKCRKSPIGRDAAFGYFNSALVQLGCFQAYSARETIYKAYEGRDIILPVGIRTLRQKLMHAFEIHRSYLYDLSYLMEMPCNRQLYGAVRGGYFF